MAKGSEKTEGKGHMDEGLLNLDPGKTKYKGHVEFRCDKTQSEHGTSTDAGKKKVTEGKTATVENSYKKGKK